MYFSQTSKYISLKSSKYISSKEKGVTNEGRVGVILEKTYYVFSNTTPNPTLNLIFTNEGGDGE
jgi:hypothetical protein